MALVYFACDYSESSWNENHYFSASQAKSAWMSKNRGNHLTLKKTFYPDIHRGFADSVRFDSAFPDLPGPPPPTVIEDKKKSVSFGKAWHDRRKSGSILVSPWWGHRCTIVRNPVHEVTKVPGGRTQPMFSGTLFGAGGSPRYDGETPYYSMNGVWSDQFVSGTRFISQAEVTDQQFFDSLVRAPGADTGTVTSALAEANQGYYDLLTELAELPETLGFLYGLLEQAREATNAVKQKEVRYKHMFSRKLMTAQQLATALAGLWLQYRYAISPIVYSIQDVEKTLGVYSRLFKTARGKNDVDKFYAERVGDMVYHSHSGSPVDRVFIKRAYSAEGLIDGLLRNISLNPFATAWELVPLSFVVDWFVNIGDVISAFTGPTVHVQQAATISRSIDTSVVYRKEDSDLTVTIQLKSYVRDTFNPLDHVGLSFDPHMTWKRSLDALALSWSFSRNMWKR